MMQDAMTAIFGTYAPIDGSPDWSYIGGVIIFSIVLFCTFRLVGGLFKR